MKGSKQELGYAQLEKKIKHWEFVSKLIISSQKKYEIHKENKCYLLFGYN